MRYGKVYFYDRMGNREPTEADKIKEALENFDAPKFRPPEIGEYRNSGNQLRDLPLESPPIYTGADPLLPRFSPGSDNFAHGSSTNHKFEHDLQLCESPITRTNKVNFEEPREFNPIKTISLREDLETTIDNGVIKGLGRKETGLEEEFDKIHVPEFNYSFQRENKFQSNDYALYDLCSQCRLEGEMVSKWKADAEKEIEKHRRFADRATLYEREMEKKEDNFQKEKQAQVEALYKHIDQTNQEIIAEQRMRNIKSPETDYYIFKNRPEEFVEDIQMKKQQLDRILSQQIEEKKQRDSELARKELQLDSLRNHQAAEEFAKIRDLEQKRAQQNQDRWKKQLELQMELQKSMPPTDQNWIWWAERPDEHGWREARLKTKDDQVERNIFLKNSSKRLEQFVKDQKDMDSMLRAAKQEHYTKLREKLHQNSELIFGAKNTTLPIQRPVIIQTNLQVEAAWRNAHEQNEKKYRILQENTDTKGTKLEKEIGLESSCARCARCTKPLNRKETFILSKERIY